MNELAKIEQVEMVPATHNPVPVADLPSLGVAGESLQQLIQSIKAPGGEGIYRVTFPKGFDGTLSRFKNEDAFLGSGISDGNMAQARLNQIHIDPTQMFMAFALMNIQNRLVFGITQRQRGLALAGVHAVDAAAQGLRCVGAEMQAEADDRDPDRGQPRLDKHHVVQNQQQYDHGGSLEDLDVDGGDGIGQPAAGSPEHAQGQRQRGAKDGRADRDQAGDADALYDELPARLAHKVLLKALGDALEKNWPCPRMRRKRPCPRCGWPGGC